MTGDEVAGEPTDAEDSQRAQVWVRGRVQGVGFRWWVRARALELGLVGYARNLSDGRVEVLAQGRRDALDAFIALLDPDADPAPQGRPGQVSGRTVHPLPPRPPGTLTGFTER